MWRHAVLCVDIRYDLSGGGHVLLGWLGVGSRRGNLVVHLGRLVS